MQNLQSLMQGLGGGFPGMGAPAEPLVKFKAGKCDYQPISGQPGKVKVTPVPTKGQLQLVKEDQMVKFQWKDRITGTVDQEGMGVNHMIFPGDAEFVKVNTGREGDRVFMLQFKGQADRRFFFWMQDKASDDDDENVKKMNDGMNGNLPSAEPAAAAAGAGGPGGAGGDQAAMMQSILGGLGGPPGASPGAAAPSASDNAAGAGATGSAASPNAVDMEQLQSVLQSLGLPPAPNAGAAPAPTTSASTPAPASSAAAGTTPASGGGLSALDLQAAMMGLSTPREPLVPLQAVVTAEEVDQTSLLDDPRVQELLIPHLPEGQRDLAGLRANIHSPQFSQTLGQLTAALQSENYNTIFANFNLNATDGATQLNQGNAVAAFLAALEAQAGRSGASEGGEDDMKVDGKDDEEPPSTS